ncbi:DMT family transporter [Anianabacter salinae]|uniref:DMT family transporter n=1 Tax=Anianabacter salinae TaxID=2851023 RepID=UPI00225DDF08|nr:DMT family transporter [Anianabacter salinae]MBV0913159.1 DMT family transporter [Anianabacter salinae]
MADLTDNTRGAGLMMASMAAFTINDTFMKTLAGEVPLFQALLIRGIVASLMLLTLARIVGGMRLDLPRRDWGLIALRTVMEIAAAYFFITALFNMPLANVTAILQVLPLVVTLSGALFLREPVGWRRMTAIVIGFIGVLMIVRPGAEGFTVFSVYALISVACVTVRDLATRRLSRDVPSFTVALSASVGVTIFAACASLVTDWQPMSVLDAAHIGGAAVFLIGGYMFSVMAMRVGEVAIVAPFRYTSILWALLLGFVVFGEWPAWPTLVGAAIVVATGVYTFYRERAMTRAALVPLRTR